MKKIRAKSAKGIANELARNLIAKYKKYDQDISGQIVVQSPEESERYGWGNCWTVVWEDGPYEWVHDNDFCPQESLPNDFYFEPYNSFVVCVAQ